MQELFWERALSACCGGEMIADGGRAWIVLKNALLTGDSTKR